MKDFVEIQYSVLWKLRFDQSYLLVETITRTRGEQFSKKEFIFVFGKLIFRLVETIFSSIFRRPLPVFFSRIFQGNLYFRLVETDFRGNNGFHKQRKKYLNKRILFYLDGTLVSTSGNEKFKYTFLLDEKTASSDRNVQKIK